MVFTGWNFCCPQADLDALGFNLVGARGGTDAAYESLREVSLHVLTCCV